jgi:hypothetical protein
MLCAVLKTILFFSTVTADYIGLSCSHIRAALVYNEALANKCIIWGVKSKGLDLLIR